MSFDPEAIRAEGPVFSEPAALQSSAAVSGYLQFYRLDFSRSFPQAEHRFGFFEAGGFQIAAHAWLVPDATHTAVMVHGYYDHVGLYRHLIEYCLQKGWSVLAYDLPGHGLSSGERATIETFEHYQTVLAAALNQAEALAMPSRLIAIGQSTGAAILMTRQLREGGFERCILLAPLYRPRGFRLRALMFPWVRRMRQQMPRRFANNSGDVEFLRWLREDDPLQWRGLPLQWAGAMIDWVARFSRLKPSDVPTLIVQGDNDGTVDWRYNVPRLRKKFRAAKTCYLNGAGHHLVNELPEIRRQIWAAIDEWLEA